MFRRSWEVQPNMGAQLLEDIGRDVRARRELGPPISIMSIIAIANRQSAEVLEEDIYSFDSEETRFLEQAEDIEARIKEAQELNDKKYMDRDDPDFRIWMKVLEEGDGLVGWRESGAAGGSDTNGETVMLGAGEERAGRGGAVRSIASAPCSGGELVMDFPGEARFLPMRRGIHITGLVSPETGDPQVDLQIQTRTG